MMSELSLTLQFLQLHRKGVDDDLPGDCSGVRQCYPGHTGPEGEAERGRHSCVPSDNKWSSNCRTFAESGHFEYKCRKQKFILRLALKL